MTVQINRRHLLLGGLGGRTQRGFFARLQQPARHPQTTLTRNSRWLELDQPSGGQLCADRAPCRNGTEHHHSAQANRLR